MNATVTEMDLLSQSIALVKEFEPMALAADPHGYCVCSSFGKDSMANIEIFRRAGVKFFVKWNITGIDPPELVYFAREQIKRLHDEGIFTYKQMYDKSMFRMIIDHKVPPSRVIRYCCDELKEKVRPELKSCFHSFGVRKAESDSRESRNEMEVIHRSPAKRFSMSRDTEPEQLSLYLNTDNADARRQFENCVSKGIRAINPIIPWSDKYLWSFIRSEKIPYCHLYDEGFSRLGCIGCPMASKSKHMEFKRYPGFYDYYLRAFDEMLIQRKIDKVDERRAAEGKKPMPWKTAQDVMGWWLEIEKHEGQLTIDDYEILEGTE